MDILTPTALNSLIAQQGKWYVSLYMPTQRKGREQQQNPIRLKNLLAEAEMKLLAILPEEMSGDSEIAATLRYKK